MNVFKDTVDVSTLTKEDPESIYFDHPVATAVGGDVLLMFADGDFWTKIGGSVMGVLGFVESRINANTTTIPLQTIANLMLGNTDKHLAPTTRRAFLLPEGETFYLRFVAVHQATVPPARTVVTSFVYMPVTSTATLQAA